jgi:2'-5' RNA ligase
MALRLFIAIEIGDEAKKSLGRIQALLRRELPAARWVKPASIHLTIRFLGDTDEREVPHILEAIAGAAAGGGAFTIALRGAGAFPNAGRPRVIWIGVDEPTGVLAGIASRLNAGLSSAGFPAADRPFTPHITIGRVRDGGGPGYGPALSRLRDVEAGVMRVADICLIRSDLAPSGPVYTVLGRAPLGG